MKLRHGLTGAALVAAASALLWLARPAVIATPPQPPAWAAVAPGLVEPAKEEREVCSAIVGTLRAVLVEENDTVAADQIIAVIADDDQKAAVEQAAAQLAAARANLAEIERAYKREAILEKSQTIAAAAVERSFNRLEVARAEAARASAALTQARANLDKTRIRAPIAGTVLKRMALAGGAVGNQPPTPIAIIGDLSRLRVRAEVDELDIGAVQQGQAVEVTADALPALKAKGAVIRVSRRFGGRRAQTDRSTEPADRKVLQVLIELEDSPPFPVGLRVDVFFLPRKN